MPNYIPYDPNQSKMVIINYTDQLHPGTFEHAIHFLIEHKLDLSVFDPSYNNDSIGRPAYDPAILFSRRYRVIRSRILRLLQIL